MRPRVLSLTGNGATTSTTSPFPVNWRGSGGGFSIGLSLNHGGSTTAFTVQYTYDNPNDYVSGTTYNSDALWYNHSTIAAKTADTDGSISTPVRAIRLSANGTGTDTATLTIIQAS